MPFRFLVAALSLALLACPQSDVPYGTLMELADRHETDKGAEGHQFVEAYELYLHPIRRDVAKVFEIGVLHGASLKMWEDYFPSAFIVGADIEPKTRFETERVKTIVADQGRRDQLQKLIDGHGSDWDLILDDGGHTMQQQQVSLGFLFPHVTPGGYYVIEDVHTSLSPPHYGAAADGSNTTLTMAEGYARTRKVRSVYMSEEEAAYVTENIDFAHLHVGNDGKSLAWILRKRED